MLSLDTTDLQLTSEKDQLFETKRYPQPFEFNQEVASVFDDMISRSVPLYQEVNQNVLDWALLCYQDNTRIYDIGCSTATTLRMLGDNFSSPVHLVGIDTSKPMLQKAEKKLRPLEQKHRVELLESPASQVDYHNASISIMNYTLQFIPIEERAKLLEKVCSGLVPGGILYLSEKVRSYDPKLQQQITQIYHNFKCRAGYSRREVERKKEALEKVLIPLTMGEHIEMLKDAGFDAVEPVVRWNSFVSYVARKKS